MMSLREWEPTSDCLLNKCCDITCSVGKLSWMLALLNSPLLTSSCWLHSGIETLMNIFHGIWWCQRRIQRWHTWRVPPCLKFFGFIFYNFVCITRINFIVINMQCLQCVFYSLISLQKLRVCVKGHQINLHT